MAEIRETAYNQTNDNKTAEISTNEAVWINKLLRLADKYPNEIHILEHLDSNYGVLLVELPKSWFKISPPRTCNLTDAQKAAASERLKNARQKRTSEV